MNKKALVPQILLATFALLFGVGLLFVVQDDDLSLITGATTTVGGGGNLSTLILFDQNDTEGGSRAAISGQQIYFYANYTNTTSGVNITGADCNINFTDLSSSMTYNVTSTFYEFNRNFGTTGLFLYNASCSAAGFEQLNVTNENITIQSAIPINDMNITSSITFSNGTFNLVDGININASNVVIICNQTVLNGSGGDTGITISVFQNTTVQGCTITAFNTGIFLLSSSNNTFSSNNISVGGSGFHLQDICKRNVIFNNTIVGSGVFGIFLIGGGGGAADNNTISNNLVQSTTGNGIRLEISSNNRVSNNQIINNSGGVLMSSFSTSGNTFSNNTFVNNTNFDIFTFPTQLNTLILMNGQNELRFTNKFINVTDIDNLFINESIVSVNSSIERNMNTTANVSFVVPSCSASLFSAPGFHIQIQNTSGTRDKCTTCTITACANNIMNFTTTSFSTIIASYPTIITIFPNATNQTQNISQTAINVSISAAKGTNITFNITAQDLVAGFLTFRWFVDGVQQFIETVSGSLNNFISDFNFNLTDARVYNVTVLVNNTETNDTFTFFVESQPLPTISNINVSGITNQSAVVNWTTDVTSNTSVNFGTALSLGTKSEINNAVLNHSRTLSGLENNTLHFFNVTSCSSSGCSTNGTLNFTTRQTNSAPVVSNVVVSSTSGTNTVSENLTVDFDVSDEDNDSIINITDWRLNGTSYALVNMPFEAHGESATNATDYSTFRINGSVVGAAWTPNGYVGGAYRFDGSGDVIKVNRSFTFRNFTYAAWINASSISGFLTIIDVDDDEQLLAIDPEGNYSIWGRCGDNPNDGYGLAKVGEWHHIAWAVNGSNYRVYEDGIQIGNGTGCSASAAGNLNIGAGLSFATPNEVFQGIIDEVRVYNKSLSSEQIRVFALNRTDLVVSQELTLEDVWSAAVTPNDKSEDGATVLSNNLTIIPPPIPTSGGGTNVVFTPTEVVPPVQPLPPVVEIPTPVTELPPAYLTSIDPATVNINPFACTEISQTDVAPALAVQSLKESPYYRNVIRGYDVLVSAFKVACQDSSFGVTLSLPDSYTNITALRCSGTACNPVDVQEVTRAVCGGTSFEDVKRKELFLQPEFFPIDLQKVELPPGGAELTSGKTKLSFVGEIKGKVSLDKLFGPAPEAKNPRIKIVGTPTVLAFENAATVGTNITLPYVLPEHVDELSIAAYALKDNQWQYLGGEVNKEAKTVTAIIPDISQYTENNKLTLALMGLICLNCYEAKLDKVYDGGTRDAVILVHGFENTPEKFEDIINDIRLTNQPWQVWTFGYPSNDPIDKSAKALADLLQFHVNEYDFVYFASHSMGGLVTQQALQYAFKENQNKIDPPYTFMNKVVKAVSVGTPNQGAFTKEPNRFFNFLVNNPLAAGLFNLNSAVIQELIGGRLIPRVPEIEYLAIAGTQPYDFTKFFDVTETNDGIVTISSAQTIGGQKVADYCSNFWSINTTHNEILNNLGSRKIIERIVAKEIAKSIANKAIIGHQQYYELNVEKCRADDQYIIIGAPITNEKELPNPGLCSCGNGVCGVDEDEVSCPTDCAKIEKPKAGLLDFLLYFRPLRNLALLLLLTIFGIVLITRRRRAQVLVIPDIEQEKKLNELIVQTRIAMRTADLDHAAMLYHRFSDYYAASSLRVQEKFKDVALLLEKEVKRRIR